MKKRKTMKIKYIILSITVILLLFLVFILSKSVEYKDDIFKETAERTSQDYKITDDSVFINLSQND